jgi:hypothetical protein
MQLVSAEIELASWRLRVCLVADACCFQCEPHQNISDSDLVSNCYSALVTISRLSTIYEYLVNIYQVTGVKQTGGSSQRKWYEVIRSVLQLLHCVARSLFRLQGVTSAKNCWKYGKEDPSCKYWPCDMEMQSVGFLSNKDFCTLSCKLLQRWR